MSYELLLGDCLESMRKMPSGIVQTCITSPPYFALRDYGTAEWVGGDAECEHIERRGGHLAESIASTRGGAHKMAEAQSLTYRHICRKCGAERVDNQIGLEETPEEYVERLVEVFREVRRLLKADGTCWINLGDSYQDKQLLGIPWRVAFALQNDGWILRSDIIWAKPNPMPESVSGSRYIRHRVTIEEYEKLSSLREAECGNLDRASNLSSLSARAATGSEAPLPEKREGASNGAGEGAARGREGEATASQPIRTRSTEQSQIRSNGKGQGHAEEGISQIPCQRQSQTNGSGASPGNKRLADTDRAKATSEPALHAFREMEGKETQGLRAAQGGISTRSSSDSRGLAGNLQATQESLLLLQEAQGVDTGSCDPHQQGWITCEGEYSSGLPELQLEEEGQSDSPLLVDCPGCPKCEEHNGYILHLSAGRPTKSHEYIFLLSKSSSYFYDADAIREPMSEATKERDKHSFGGAFKGQFRGTPGEQRWQDGRAIESPKFYNEAGRNRRSVWTVTTKPYSGAHFATFPPDLIEPCILAGSRVGDTVLDPFNGSGTTGAVALKHGRKYIGLELNPDYIALAHKRIQQSQPMLLLEGV